MLGRSGHPVRLRRDIQRLVALSLRQIPITRYEREQCSLVITMGSLTGLAVLVQKIDDFLTDRLQFRWLG